jgi:hypothetical protein
VALALKTTKAIKVKFDCFCGSFGNKNIPSGMGVFKFLNFFLFFPTFLFLIFCGLDKTH